MSEVASSLLEDAIKKNTRTFRAGGKGSCQKVTKTCPVGTYRSWWLEDKEQAGSPSAMVNNWLNWKKIGTNFNSPSIKSIQILNAILGRSYTRLAINKKSEIFIFIISCVIVLRFRSIQAS